MRETLLPFSPPAIGAEEIAEVVKTMQSDWLTTGPRVQEFEKRFASYVNAESALALNSGTAAMHVALASLGIGPGDEVITTPQTFCSTAHVIEHVGATPLFVDVEPDTLNIDPNQVERVLRNAGGRVKAIMPVHLYGHPCAMDKLLDLAAEFDIAIVEDAAHSLPAEFRGELIGASATAAARNIRRMTAFSFYVTKNLATVEGGMLTGPARLIDAARPWALHGMSRDAWKRYGGTGKWFYEITLPGFKYNMMDISAAIGLCQLEKLPAMYRRRKEIAKRYRTDLNQELLEMPAERAEVAHAWHLFVLRLKGGHGDEAQLRRDQVIAELAARNIATSVHFIPVHVHPYYRDRYGYAPEAFPVAYDAFQRMFSIPLHPRLTDDDVADVVDAVNEVAALQQAAAHL